MGKSNLLLTKCKISVAFFFFFLHLLNGIQAQGKKKVSSLKISSSKAYKIHKKHRLNSQRSLVLVNSYI